MNSKNYWIINFFRHDTIRKDNCLSMNYPMIQKNLVYIIKWAKACKFRLLWMKNKVFNLCFVFPNWSIILQTLAWFPYVDCIVSALSTIHFHLCYLLNNFQFFASSWNLTKSQIICPQYFCFMFSSISYNFSCLR